MAYAFVQSGFSHNTNGTGSAQTASSITVTQHNTLIVWLVSTTAGSQTLTGNGNTYVNAGTFLFGGVTVGAYYVQDAAGGATGVASTDGNCLAIYVAEYSGLANSGGSSSVVGNGQSSPGTGANILTSTALNVTTAPAAVFGLAIDKGGIQTTPSNTGTMTAGTTLAWNSRSTSWVDGAGVSVGIAEDIRVTATGNVTATAGLTGNKGFSDMSTVVFSLPEPAAAAAPALLGQICM